MTGIPYSQAHLGHADHGSHEDPVHPEHGEEGHHVARQPAGQTRTHAAGHAGMGLNTQEWVGDDLMVCTSANKQQLAGQLSP